MPGELLRKQFGQTPERITSAANPLLKEIRRAARAGSLTDDGCCVAEGWNLLKEALRSGCEVRVVVVSGDTSEWRLEQNGEMEPAPRALVVPEKLFREIASTESPQGVVALVRPPQWEPEALFGQNPLLIVLDGLQDPGNAGTILRAAEAFGATGAVWLSGTASPYNPKTLRASAGSVFRFPLWHQVSPDEFAARLGGIPCIAADPQAPEAIDAVDLRQPCAIIIGSEGQGLRPRLRERAWRVRITTRGVESLNAAMAASILLYEARRQRGWEP